MGLLDGLLKTSKGFIGLDIGASAVKMMSGKRVGSVFQVDKLAIVPIPLRAIDERGIVDAGAVVSSLSAAFEQFGQGKPGVATAVHGGGVLTKRIAISKDLPKKEIPNQVRWEAEQVFPVDISSILVDHILLGERANVPDGPPGQPGWDLLLVGVRREDAMSLSEVVASASGTVKLLDLDAFVVGDFADPLVGIGPDEAVALVDVGAAATRVSVRHRGNVTFIREFAIGGNAFTDAIAQGLGLSFEDAEALKIQPEGAPQEAQDVLRPLLMNWKTDLQQCEDVFVTQDGETLISRWVFFGGASVTPGLMDVLRDERFGEKVLELPCEGAFEAKGKDVDPEVLRQWARRLVTAAGLCSRGG